MTARVLRISPTLSLPTEFVTSTTAVFGGKGMGKTNLGGVMVEECSKAGLRWSLLDPMGVAWGLRHAKDGKGPGVECVILGGPHGDIPIEPTGGAVAADLVVDETANVIIDFSRHADGKMWSNGERVRFVTDYAKRLFERQGSMVGGRRREPLLQIIDEAARYIPQVIPSGAIDLAKCVGAWEQICEEGRNIGLGVVFLTQRSARIAKSVTELADVMFAFRTIGPNSLDAILDWLGQHVEKAKVKELAERVRGLDVGEALVVSPGWLKTDGVVVKIRERETYDSSATPKAGQKAVRVTGAAAKPDLAAYQTKMTATIERAKLDDPKFLRTEVDRLKREVAKAQTLIDTARPKTVTIDNKTAIERAVARAVEKIKREFVSDIKSVKRVVAKLSEDAHQLQLAAGALHIGLDEMVKDADVRVSEAHVPEAPLPRGRGEPPTMGTFSDSRRPSVFTPGNSHLDQPGAPASGIPARARGVRSMAGIGPGDPSLPDGERKVLTAIAQYEGVDREQLTVLTGYKKSSRDAYLQRLRSKGLTADNGRIIEATDEGIKALGAYEKLPEGDSLREYWLNRLPEGEAKILTIVCHAYPRPIQRDAIDAGYLKSSRDAYLQRLAARKLVSFPARGAVLASRNLFDL